MRCHRIAKSWPRKNQSERSDLPRHIIIQFKIKMSQLLVRIYKLSHTVLRKKVRVAKVKHDSHRLTVKSEQNITANLSRWNPREKGRRLGVTSFCCAWRNVLWWKSSLVHSGKKWWIRKLVRPFYIFFLNPDYVAAHSLLWLISVDCGLCQDHEENVFF